MSISSIFRPLGAFAAIAALVTSLTACSSDDANDESGSGSDAGYPRTVTTSVGETTIEQAPERIVTLGNPAFENAIAFGVEPVGASVNNIEGLPYLADYVDYEGLDASLADPYSNEINYEGIAAREPDLIIAPAWPQFADEDVMKELNKIAPVLVFDMQDANNDWRVGVRQIGEALDQVDVGEQLIADAEAAFDEVAAKHPDLGTHPYSFGLFYNSEIMLASAGNILRLFGMQPSDTQRSVEEESTAVTYSAETMGSVEGDLILLMPSPEEAAAELEASPLWDGQLSERVVWLSQAQGEAINNAGILGKTWLPGDLDAIFSAID